MNNVSPRRFRTCRVDRWSGTCWPDAGGRPAAPWYPLPYDDSAEHLAKKTKALGIHARMLELLTKMGVAHTAIERGLKNQRSILLVLAAMLEATAVERQWREIEALLAEGYEQMIEAYLITKQVVAGSEQEARRILHDETDELHQCYESEQGGLVLMRPDGYIGFWGPFGETAALLTYVQEMFVPDYV